MSDEYTLSGFAEIFTKLTRIHETSTLWTDFLEYIIDYFLLNSKKEMRYWTKKTDTYTDEEKEIFWEMFNYWLKLSQQEINKNGWYDFFGEFYEAYILSQFKAGDKAQFFTPAPVSDLMSSIAEDKELHDGTYTDKKTANRVAKELQKNNWDKSKLKTIREKLGCPSIVNSKRWIYKDSNGKGYTVRRKNKEKRMCNYGHYTDYRVASIVRDSLIKYGFNGDKEYLKYKKFAENHVQELDKQNIDYVEGTVTYTPLNKGW